MSIITIHTNKVFCGLDCDLLEFCPFDKEDQLESDMQRGKYRRTNWCLKIEEMRNERG